MLPPKEAVMANAAARDKEAQPLERRLSLRILCSPALQTPCAPACYRKSP